MIPASFFVYYNGADGEKDDRVLWSATSARAYWYVSRYADRMS